MKSTIYLLIFAILTQASAAFAGRNPLDAVCLVSFQSESRGQVFCTGTLLHGNIVVTAGQCLREGEEDIVGGISVSCGSQGFIHTERFWVTGVRIYKDGNLDSGQDSGVDFAMLRLNRHATWVKPMALPLKLDEFKKEFLVSSSNSSNEFELKWGVECRSSWFELNPKTKFLTQRSHDFTPGNDVKISFRSDLEENAALTIQLWGHHVHPSSWETRTGASFYCRGTTSNQWKLLGLSSSYFVSGSKRIDMEFLASTISPHFRGSWRNTLAIW